VTHPPRPVPAPAPLPPRIRRRRAAALVAAGALALVAARGPGAPPAPADARAAPSAAPSAARAARVLTIEAMDYAFRAPAAVPAGLTTIRLVNRGTRLHHVQLNRLEQGKTLADMLRDWKPGVAGPSYMAGAGGPTAAVGGQTLEAQAVLRPGRYAIICWVPAADGQLHVHKGMMGTLEVTPAPGAAAAAARGARGAAQGRRDDRDARLRLRAPRGPPRAPGRSRREPRAAGPRGRDGAPQAGAHDEGRG
jgi:hypothetical protein